MQAESNDEIVLTPTQQAMLNASLHHPDDPPYLLQLCLSLSAEVAESAWRAAWMEVVSAHDILRMGYAGGKSWIAETESPPEWISENLAQLAPADFHEQVQLLLRRDRQAGFELHTGSTRTLCRCLWIHPPIGEVPLWCLSIHHSLVDGNSLAPLVRKIVQSYETHKPVPYESHFWSRARQVRDRNWQGARDHFRALVESHPPAGDPRERMPHRCNLRKEHGDPYRVPLPIEPALQEQIDSQHAHRTDTLIHAAWSLVLSRITDNSQVVFGATRHCRGNRDAGLLDAIGPFANMLPLCIQVPEDSATEAWLTEVSYAWQALEPFETCPLREIEFTLKEQRLEGRSFETLVNIAREAPVIEVERVLGRLAANSPVFHQSTDIPLSLVVHLQPKLEGVLVAQREAFSPQQSALLASLFVQALQQIVSKFALPVRELSLVKREAIEEQQSRVVRWPARCALDLLRHTVATHGNALALSSPSRSLDFVTLWQYAGSFATQLQAMDVHAQDVVAILTGRSIDTVVAMIGALRAGALPFVVNEALPQDSLVERLLSAGSRFLVSSPESDIELDSRLTSLKSLSPTYEASETDFQDVYLDSNDLAYLVATSGTTGTPNIVMIEQAGLANMLQGYAEVLQPAPGDVRYQSASAGSDTFVLEVMLYLCFGACLHIEPDLLTKGLTGFDHALRQRGITILGLPSSLWREWAALPRHNVGEKGALRAVICSMERTDPDALREWRESRNDGLLWINAYGPSEATCVASLFPLQPGEATPSEDIPVGRPLPNVQLRVVDAKLRQLPTGVIGEIAIGGTGIGRGYVNNPELTEVKFVSDPFNMESRARLYLTGDLGYFREDGNLVFVGRTDNQVKIRGHRVELEEVELTLTRYPQVHDAAAVAVRQNHAIRLVMFYTASDDLDIGALRKHLLKLLPSAAMPHHFVRRDKIPRDSLGKVSRRLLSQEAEALYAADTSHEHEHFEYRAEDTLEQRLCSLFARALGSRCLTAQEDFFQSGGDSLGAVVLISDVERYTGFTPSIADLFMFPTPARLSAHLEDGGSQESPQCLVPLARGTHSKETLPLLFFHGYRGDLFQLLPLANKLGSDRDVWGLQAIELAGAARDTSVEAMAGRYAAAIQREFADTPCLLCGYSAGGLIAFETARQLLAKQHPVERLLIIDSLPCNLPMHIHLGMHAAHMRNRLLFHCKTLASEQRDVFNYLKDRVQGMRRLMSKGGRPDTAKRNKLGVRNTDDYYGSMVSMYQPRPLRVAVTLFQSTAGMRDPSAGWRYLATRGLRVVLVPWPHLDIMQPAALNDLVKLFNKELKA